jgi:hypothetical protein
VPSGGREGVDVGAGLGEGGVVGSGVSDGTGVGTRVGDGAALSDGLTDPLAIGLAEGARVGGAVGALVGAAVGVVVAVGSGEPPQATAISATRTSRTVRTGWPSVRARPPDGVIIGRRESAESYRPRTSTGVELSTVVPSPSSPDELLPQHQARPSATAHAWIKPALMAVTPARP